MQAAIRGQLPASTVAILAEAALVGTQPGMEPPAAADYRTMGPAVLTSSETPSA
jgi:hypothetical protein